MNFHFIPAFPPKGFTIEDVEKLNELIVKSELKELNEVREILKPYLRTIPREFKTVSQRVNYLINK